MMKGTRYGGVKGSSQEEIHAILYGFGSMFVVFRDERWQAHVRGIFSDGPRPCSLHGSLGENATVIWLMPPVCMFYVTGIGLGPGFGIVGCRTLLTLKIP